MPLYEAIYLVNSRASLSTVAQVMKQKAQCVFNNGGVIRRLENMGIMPFAYPMYRNRQRHYKGRWVLMLYDASAKCQKQVTDMMKTDPEVVRWAVYKQNDVFRDKYDEVFIHQGAFQGEVSALERDEEKMTDLNEAIDLQRLKRSDRFDWPHTEPIDAAALFRTEEGSAEAIGVAGLPDLAAEEDDRLSPLEQLFNDIQKSK